MGMSLPSAGSTDGASLALGGGALRWRSGQERVWIDQSR